MTMKRWLWPVVALVVALIAASCAAPDPPDAWAVQRLTPTEDVVADPGVCDDVRALALGSRADDTDIGPTLDELGRISAVVGASAALPDLNALRALDDETDLSDLELGARRHDLLLAAAEIIDDATSAVCEIPAFSALYAATGFADCYFPMEIAVGAYTLAGNPGTCTSQGRPTFLPCWTTDGSHLPVDCVSGEIVQAVNDRWETAGPPRPVVIGRPVPAQSDGPPLVAPTGAAACADLTGLFLVNDAPNGSAPEFDRLAAAAAGLDPSIQDLVNRFIEANNIGPDGSAPSFAEFEALVAELDRATADLCGFPLVSAWASLTGPLDQLPCWEPTGAPYPAFTRADCV
jgi:hypothetical protein